MKQTENIWMVEMSVRELALHVCYDVLSVLLFSIYPVSFRALLWAYLIHLVYERVSRNYRVIEPPLLKSLIWGTIQIVVGGYLRRSTEL